MPRGPAPQWRARKQPVADDWLLASVSQAGGHGQHDGETGFYADLVMRDLADRPEAEEWKRALHRSAVYLHKWGLADIGVSAKIERSGGGYIIRYRAVNKQHAQSYVVRTYGPDPARWPYWARGRAA
jgi:hypothetical protein